MSSTTSKPLLRGTAALIIWGSQSNIPVEQERELNKWWTNEHLPERLAIPGFHRTRRYYYSSTSQDDTATASNDSSKHDSDDKADPQATTSHYLVLYEVSSLSTLTSPAYMSTLNNPTPSTKKFMPVLASMNRSACRVLLSVSRGEFSQCHRRGAGGTLAQVVFPVPSSTESREHLLAYLEGDAWTLLTSFFASSILAMHLLEHDDEPSKSGSATKSYDDVNFQDARGGDEAAGKGERKWMLLVEFSDALDAPFASYKEKCMEFAEGLSACGVDLGKVKEEIYGLVVVMEE